MQYKSDDALAKEALESVAVITNLFGRRERRLCGDATVRKAAETVAALVAREAFLFHIPFDSDSVGTSSIMDVQSASCYY